VASGPGVHIAAALAGLAVLLALGCATAPEPPSAPPPARPAATPAPPAGPADRARSQLAGQGIEFSSREFLDRCFRGDVATVLLFLEAGMPATTKGPRGSALDDAITQKRVAVAKVLLAAGANPDEVVDRYGTTILHRAVDSGNPAIVEALLAAKANPSPVNEYKVSPLSSASLEGRIEMVKLLIARGADVGTRDASGGTALSSAVLRGHLEIARLLIAAGADVRRDRKALLDLARQQKNMAMEKLILEAAGP